MSTHKTTVGDTRKPIGRILYEGENPVDFTGKTAQFEMYDSEGEPVVEQTADHVTVEPTRSFTVSAANGWLYSVGHHASSGCQVVLSTTGSLEGTGLEAGTRYFVTQKTPNNFKLSHTPTGSAIPLAGAGTGNHSFKVVGSVQYDFQAADVDTAGTYQAWFSVHEGGEFDHFPNDDEGITVEIKALP